jgi:hypothetical protein
MDLAETIPCGGGFEYLHRSPASRRRQPKGNPVPGGITGFHPVPGGYKHEDLALQVGRISNMRQQNMVMSPSKLGPENDYTYEDQQQL